MERRTPRRSRRRRRCFVIRNECQLYFNQTASPICESAGVASNFGRKGLLYLGQACCSTYTCFATKITRMSRSFASRRPPILHGSFTIISRREMRRVPSRGFNWTRSCIADTCTERENSPFVTVGEWLTRPFLAHAKKYRLEKAIRTAWELFCRGQRQRAFYSKRGIPLPPGQIYSFIIWLVSSIFLPWYISDDF